MEPGNGVHTAGSRQGPKAPNSPLYSSPSSRRRNHAWMPWHSGMAVTRKVYTARLSDARTCNVCARTNLLSPGSVTSDHWRRFIPSYPAVDKTEAQ